MAKPGLAPHKKGADLSGSAIFFEDESGFMLQPVRRRTWAPSGKTPVLRAWDRHDRLSTVGFISVSPARHRLSLYFHISAQNIDADQLIWLLKLLHRRYRHHVVIVWDGLPAHRKAAKYFEQNHPDWFTFEQLPPYSPQLNPVEQCWSHTKYADLANFVPDDVNHLRKAIDKSITKQNNNKNLLRSFFKHAKLTIKPVH
jgi:transposase